MNINKATALQLWNDDLKKVLEESLFNEDMSFKHKVMDSIYAAQQFEVTKHRVIVDEIVGHLTALTEELKNTNRIRWIRRKELIAQIKGTQIALLCVVNTPPIKQTQCKLSLN